MTPKKCNAQEDCDEEELKRADEEGNKAIQREIEEHSGALPADHHKPAKPSKHSHSKNTVFRPGQQIDQLWKKMDGPFVWPVRMFTCFSSIEMQMGINKVGLTDTKTGRVFCKFKDIQGIGLAWVANYLHSPNMRHNDHANKCKKAICISILLRHRILDDSNEDDRLNFAVCCGRLRRDMARTILSYMHQLGIVPMTGNGERMSVRRTRKFVKKLKDDRKFTITFDHSRRMSRRYEEYGLRKHQERYQQLAGSKSEADAPLSDEDRIVKVKRRASRISKSILKATIAEFAKLQDRTPYTAH